MSNLVKCCVDSELPNFIEAILAKCTSPTCCCGCCSALRPRYKRLVDNVFPVNPQDGLVKSNMDKLTFYALSSPEKLDRIGEYLYQKVSRDIYRRRNGLVVVGMEVMDQLLVACHAQTLNLFVESFLKIVQKLLESSEPQLQILATQSFVKFANIEEDTPSYHRRYDFFVSKFSSMCHNNSDDPEVRDQIRLAGIRGLQGVVRKTDSDDLVENIWEQAHMDKIVPSLLFSMQQGRYKFQGGDSTPDGPQEEKTDPPTLAENCLRELVGRASFGNIRSVLRPVLRHLDVHELWVPNNFAIHTFRIIMFSIQVQYSYAVVEILMSHLDENSKADPKIRTSIADVLSKIIAIAAGESVGPSVLEIVNSLLTHLWQSVLHSPPASNAEACLHEKQYQDALINALGEYVNHLPDYHKIEIMMFIMGKVPLEALDINHDKDSANALLQNMLLKSLLKVGTKYKTVHYTSAFPLSFLEPLLRTSLAPNPEVRLLVQQILHTMIDRHGNQSKLAKPTVDVSELGLSLEKCSLPDILFIKKNGPEIYLSLYESLELPTNGQENIEAVYTTMALLCVELACDETVMDLLRLVLSIQDIAVTSINMSAAERIHLHGVVVSMLVLIPNVVPLSPLMDYAVQIVAARREKTPHLLPPLRSHYNTSDTVTNLPPETLVDQTAVIEALGSAGMDTSRLQTQHSGMPRHSWVDAHMQHMKGSVGDLNSFSVEVDSVSSSPGVQRKRPEEELTFDSLKKLMNEPAQARQEAEMERRLQISETFRTAKFEDLVARTQVKNDLLQNKLNEIFGKITSMSDVPRAMPVSENDPLKCITPAQPYEIRFPELFVY